MDAKLDDNLFTGTGVCNGKKKSIICKGVQKRSGGFGDSAIVLSRLSIPFAERREMIISTKAMTDEEQRSQEI